MKAPLTLALLLVLACSRAAVACKCHWLKCPGTCLSGHGDAPQPPMTTEQLELEDLASSAYMMNYCARFDQDYQWGPGTGPHKGYSEMGCLQLCNRNRSCVAAVYIHNAAVQSWCGNCCWLKYDARGYFSSSKLIRLPGVNTYIRNCIVDGGYAEMQRGRKLLHSSREHA